MDYKVKYEQAIADARAIIKDYKERHLDDIAKRSEEDSSAVFPELKESEDERIRQRIIHALHGDVLEMSEIKEAIDWLEKQGEQILANSAKTCKDEQKPADKVEPKFKVGDWVVTDKCDTVQIGAVNNGYYTLYNGMIFNMSYVDKCWHRWTIADAKDGDVLACENGWICIFRCLNDNLFSSHCFMDNEGWFCEYGGQGHTLDNRICGEIHPATKEQQDFLFKKMKEAGYWWDAEKKELKKIEQKSTIIPKFKVGDIIRHKEQGFTCKIIAIDTEYRLSECSGTHLPFDSQDAYELVEQKPWSEEDEKIIQWIATDIKRLINDNKKANIIADQEIKWLESLRPQNRWKPSDEQMEALEEATHIVGSKYKSCLASLYQELKKLK